MRNKQQNISTKGAQMPKMYLKRAKVNQKRTKIKARATQPSGNPKSPRICILGGGFGGLYTALRLSSLVWTKSTTPEVTLVDPRERFVFKPLLYELVTGELKLSEVAPKYADLIDRGTSFIQSKAISVTPFDDNEEAVGGTVELENGSAINYDWLVLACGSETKLEMVKGVKEHAIPFCNLEDAEHLKFYLQSFHKKTPEQTIAIVGGGVNGVELAASIADKYSKSFIIKLIAVGDDILKAYPERQRQNAWRALSRGGVDVILGTSVREVKQDVESGQYTLDLHNTERGEETILVDKVIWTAGQKPVSISVPKNVDMPFLMQDEVGNILTENTLRMLGTENVFALGDNAVIRNDEKQTKDLAFTAQVAFQQADYAAWNLWSAINGQPLLPFQYQHLGDMMSLGHIDATVGLPVGNLTLSGIPASLLRKLAYIYRMPTLEQGAKLGLSWLPRVLASELNTASKM